MKSLFLFLVSFWILGCSTMFPKFETASSHTIPKQEFIKHVIDPREYVGKYYAPIEKSSPLIFGDTIYVGSVQDSFLAVSKKNATVFWRKKIVGGVESTATYYDDKIYVGGNDGFFYCLDAKTGKEIWKYNTKVEILSKAVVKGGIVYFSTANNGLYALKADSGQWVWYYNKGYIQKISVRGSSSPIYFDGKIYIGFSDGYFYSFNAFDGKGVWFKKITEDAKFIDVDLTPHVSQRDVIVGSYDGGLYSFNPQTGHQDWKVSTEGIRGLIVENDAVFITTISGGIAAYNRLNGQKQWQSQIKHGTPSAPILVEDQIIFTTGEKYVYSLSMDDGSEIWRYSIASGAASAPVFSEDKVYIFSNFSAIHVIDPFYLLFNPQG